MRFDAALLDAALGQHLPDGASGLLVGASGGPDSACLLAALAELSAGTGGYLFAGRRLPVRAVHVDHGLQPAAVALGAATRALCRRWSVPLAVLAVDVQARGESLEAAARAARYGALRLELGRGECLLTAHHAEDQAETVLLQLLRGAGVKGLSAMPACRPFGAGWHVRPLLDVPRQALEDWGAARALEAVRDPMNRDPRFDRAYLRAELWPRIAARWPGAAAALTRAARHFADAQELLDEGADRALERLRDGEALSVPGLRCLPERERVQALRRWLQSAAVPLPSSARLAEGLRQALTADADHLPAVLFGAHALRRYRDRLFLTAARAPVLAPHREWRVCAGATLELGPGLGTLRWVARPGGLDASRLPPAVSVRRRRGGERLRAGAHARTQSVQHLCQSLGVLPWMRDALPLVFAGESLIAVGDLWQDARWRAPAGAPGFECVWEHAPVLC